MPAAAPIGGQLVSSFGGLVGFSPYRGDRTIDSVGARTGLDVARWSLHNQYVLDDTTHTGSFGGQGVNITCQTVAYNLQVVWDLTNVPDIIQRIGVRTARGVAANNLGLLNLDFGCRMYLCIGDDDISPYNDGASAEYYFIPSTKVLSQVPIIDPASKKMVRIDLTGVANSRVFHLPHDQAALNVYTAHLAIRNWVY